LPSDEGAAGRNKGVGVNVDQVKRDAFGVDLPDTEGDMVCPRDERLGAETQLIMNLTPAWNQAKLAIAGR
jgi:hypothetical protein